MRTYRLGARVPSLWEMIRGRQWWRIPDLDLWAMVTRGGFLGRMAGLTIQARHDAVRADCGRTLPLPLEWGEQPVHDAARHPALPSLKSREWVYRGRRYWYENGERRSCPL